MSRDVKIALGIIGGALALCVCGVIGGLALLGFVGEKITTELVADDPAEIAAAAQDMLAYELPPGYQEELLMNIVFGKILIISAVDDLSTRPVITVTQLNSGMEIGDTSEEDMQRSMRANAQEYSGGSDADFQWVEDRVVVIDEQEVTLSVYEGEDSQSGTRMRQVVSGFFTARGGPTMVMIMGPVSSWNQSEIDAFLSSIG